MPIKDKRKVLPHYYLQPVISRERANRENLLVLSTSEYASKFYVSISTSHRRYRQLKVRGFKSGRHIFLVVPKNSKDGF